MVTSLILVTLFFMCGLPFAQAQGPVIDARTGLTLSYEDLSDWMRRYPGMYPLDYGVYGAPVLFSAFGQMPWELTAVKDDVPQNRVSDGLFDSNLQPPAELESLQYDLMRGRGAGAFNFTTRSVPADSPYTEFQIREGYYNFGSVDLAHGQPVYGRSHLEFTGRLVWYDGLRAGTSDSRTSRLRGRYTFHVGRQWKSRLTYGGASVQANSASEFRGSRVEREEAIFEVQRADSFPTVLDPRVMFYARRDREQWNAEFNEREQVFGWRFGVRARAPRQFISLSQRGGISEIRYPGIGDYSQVNLALDVRDSVSIDRISVVGEAGGRSEEASFVSSDQEFGILAQGNLRAEIAMNRAISLHGGVGFSETGVPPAWRRARYRIEDRPLQIAPEFVDLFRYYSGSLAGAAAGGVDRHLKADLGARLRRGRTLVDGRILMLNRVGDFSNQFELAGDSVTLVYAKGGVAEKIGVATDVNVPLRHGLSIQSWWWTELDHSDPSRAVEMRGFARLFFEREYFKAPLVVRSHFSYDHIGTRSAVSDRGSQVLGPAHLVGFRLSAQIHGVTLIWGVDNLLAQHYYLMPGYLMIRKEEYLGVHWTLRL